MSALDNTINVVQAIRQDADAILGVVEAAAPGIAGQVAAGQAILDLVTGLVGKALEAYQAAAGVAITPETIATLIPNPKPLTPPTQG